jgi:hypothetical protein
VVNRLLESDLDDLGVVAGLALERAKIVVRLRRGLDAGE